MTTVVDGDCGLMFALVKPDLRACTRLLSVAAAAHRSPLLLLLLLLHATAAGTRAPHD
jgi:hypothetical protein